MASDSQHTDLVLYNGALYTQHGDNVDTPGASAVYVRDGRFHAVGSDVEMRALAGPGVRQIDLEGRCAVPGLTDAHIHFYGWSLLRQQLGLAALPSLDALREEVRAAAVRVEPGRWVLGQGWNESRWPVPRFPTRADLDEVAPHNPVILWRSDMHVACVNSRALEAAGVTADTPAPAGSSIDHDAAGQLTGILKETAINLVSGAIPPATEDEALQAMREAIAAAHRLGLTGVHDMRLMGGLDGPPAFRAWQRLHDAGELRLRVWMQIPGEQIDQAAGLGLRTGLGDATLRVGAAKLFTDGSMGGRTAWMLEPYDDGTGSGLSTMPMEEMEGLIERAHQAGLACAVHAIGDRATREVVGIFERVLGRRPLGPPPGAPHRIEHVQLIQPEDLRRLARLGVVASVQPLHATDDIPITGPAWGERSRYAYAFRDMLDLGMVLALGSDCPVANPNPLWGIHAAVTRQGRDGRPEAGWYPAQRLSVAEAVYGYTMGAAVISGQAARQGSIAPGKLADLVVLDRDIFRLAPSELHSVRPVMTVFDGQVVYEA